MQKPRRQVHAIRDAHVAVRSTGNITTPPPRWKFNVPVVDRAGKHTVKPAAGLISPAEVPSLSPPAAGFRFSLQ